jgi:phosphatidylglycerophosphate synthase
VTKRADERQALEPAASRAAPVPTSLVDLAEHGGLRGVPLVPTMLAALRSGLRSAGAVRGRQLGFLAWTVFGAALAAWVLWVMRRWLTPADWAVAVAVESAWFGLFTFLSYAHLDLVRRADGTPHRGFLLPNGMTLNRMTLAPLVCFAAVHAQALRPGADLVLWPLVYVVSSDLLDGQIARFAGLRSEWGRLADPVSDVFLASWFAPGLWAGGWLVPWLGFLIVFRFAGALAGVFLVWGRGRSMHITPTWPGRVANLAVEFYLPALFAAAIRWPSWFGMTWLAEFHWVVGALLAVSIVYSFARFLRALRARPAAA